MNETDYTDPSTIDVDGQITVNGVPWREMYGRLQEIVADPL
jgi:hypothetical protein